MPRVSSDRRFSPITSLRHLIFSFFFLIAPDEGSRASMNFKDFKKDFDDLEACETPDVVILNDVTVHVSVSSGR